MDLSVGHKCLSTESGWKSWKACRGFTKREGILQALLVEKQTTLSYVRAADTRSPWDPAGEEREFFIP